jgi:membrane protease YdiL (CAAX protease family)
LPTAVLFGLLHSNNPDATTLSTLNTKGWGVVLGVAVLRSGDLWLAIGLHYGWNLVLPLFGVDVSGFKVVGTTGYAMRWSVGDLWSGGAYGPEGGLLTSIVLVPLAVYLWRAPIRGQKLPLLSVHEEG